MPDSHEEGKSLTGMGTPCNPEHRCPFVIVTGMSGAAEQRVIPLSVAQVPLFLRMPRHSQYPIQPRFLHQHDPARRARQFILWTATPLVAVFCMCSQPTFLGMQLETYFPERRLSGLADEIKQRCIIHSTIGSSPHTKLTTELKASPRLYPPPPPRARLPNLSSCNMQGSGASFFYIAHADDQSHFREKA